ncbi:MAG: hypothetical protein WC369_10505 [Dehalococcoidales bacterium]|jgi:hypothetical protein
MKKFAFMFAALVLFVSVAGVSYAEFKKFCIYTDRSSRDNHYTPSGWMGDYGDIKLDTGWKEGPHGGTTCVKITYTAEQKQGAGWCGIYWQNPANNWGMKSGGFDLTGAKKLVFWARGGKGGEVLAEVKIGGITGEYADTDTASIGPLTLTADWKEYIIDLTGKDLTYISGGFCWAASAADNPDGFTIYFDDVYYE